MNRLSLILSTILAFQSAAPSSVAVTVGSLSLGTPSRYETTVPEPHDKPKESQINYWMPVPAWLAGTWETRYQTFLDSYDCRSGKQLLKEPTILRVSKHRVTGAQQDSSGQIWHYASTPYVRTSRTKEFCEKQTIEQLDLLSVSDEKVKVRTVGKVEQFSDQNSETRSSFYEVTIVTYSPIGEGLVKTDLTITDYDVDGKAILHSISVCIERRVRPFAVVDHDERGDLRGKFTRFMDERNSTGH